MKRAVALVLGTLMVSISGAAVGLALSPNDPAPVIHEEDPGWQCRVHGNQVCGPTP